MDGVRHRPGPARWAIGHGRFEPTGYRPVELGALEAAPFFAGAGGPVTVAFDIPHITLSSAVRGVQLTAWGAHSPQYGPGACPTGLYDEIVTRFGAHPAVRSDSQPGWHHAGYQEAIVDGLEVGRRRRRDHVLVAGPPTRLGARRHRVQRTPHRRAPAVARRHRRPSGPAPRRRRDGGPAPPRLRAVDAALGRLVEAAGPDTTVVVFALHDTQPNASDVAGMFILPELLARADLGRTVLRNGRRPGASVGGTAPLLPVGDAPMSTLLRRRRPPRELVRSALRRRSGPPWYELDRRPYAESTSAGAVGADGTLATDGAAAGDRPGAAFGYQAPTWYRRAWPRMRAFALPTFSDPQVRVNLAGREPNGDIVAPEDYGRELDRIEALVRGCRDTRTGQPVVGDVERPRAADPGAPGGPPADLVVRFAPVVDTVAHPDVGTVGAVPVPAHRRARDHRLRARQRAGATGLARRPFAAQDLGPRLVQLL